MVGESKYEDLQQGNPGLFSVRQGMENRLELGHQVRDRVLERWPCITTAAAGGLQGCALLGRALFISSAYTGPAAPLHSVPCAFQQHPAGSLQGSGIGKIRKPD